jgi:thioredoxin reductase (NADPH)
MAPLPDAVAVMDEAIANNKVIMFSKSYCPFCNKIKELFKQQNITYEAIELDLRGDGAAIQEALVGKTGQKTVPNTFINGNHVGGHDDTMKLYSEDKLLGMVNAEFHNYEFDVIVLGGGSGGLACSKELSRLGKKVAVCDFIQPTPKGTTWGLGGTCVNVGCIPKKLMHQAALLGEGLKDAEAFGWQATPPVHSWEKMKEEVQNHIGSLNWGYRVQLREKGVTYMNEYAEFIDDHTIKTVNKKGKESKHTANKFVIATGGRPTYPGIPGDKEFGITSDDIFSLPHAPGKTLLIGASYIALECAGFLKGLGFDVTVMVRSIFLRGFDQQMANKIGEYMEEHGINMIRECTPSSLEEVTPGTPGTIRVNAKYKDGTDFTDEFNTVVFAIGRTACTQTIGLDKVGVQMNPKNGKIVHDEGEQTTAKHVYAIGDVLDGKLELTPVAIQAGKLLARRMTGQSTKLMDYVNVPTTVFTPLEYGAIGLSEEDAIEKHGEGNIEVYHIGFQPLEWTVAHRPESACYAKLVCLKTENEKVVGLHYLGPNAGEVTQGFGGMIQLGATKENFDNLVGIHPTTAENFTTLDISKSSGADAAASGC